MKNRLNRHKLIRRAAGLLLLTLCLIVGTGTIPALAALPMIPHQFWGTVTVGGSAAPAGTVITARIPGAPDTTTTTGAGGSYSLQVPPDDPDTPAKEGGVTGDTISFYVGTTLVTGTATFQNGGATLKNLAIAAGPATKVRVETAANGSGTVVAVQNVPSGTSITVYAITRDASDAFVANVAADAWSLQSITGGVVNGDLVASGDMKSATFTGNVIGTAQIRATSGALTPTNSGTQTVTFGAANKLAFTTQPSGGTAGTAFGTQPAVSIQDASGNTVTTAANPITLAIGTNPGGGTLTVDTNPLNAVNGVANFSGVSINNAGTGYTLTATNTGLTPATSNAFNVTAGGVLQKIIGTDDLACQGLMVAGYFALGRFQALATANVTQFNLKANTAGNVKVAMYSDNAGQPGALLNAINTDTAVAAGWNNIVFPSTPIVTGTFYWLAFNSSAQLSCYNATPGSYMWKPAPYNTFTFPADAGAGWSGANTNFIPLLAGWGLTTPPAPPAAPTWVSPGETIRFGWNAVAGATKYQLQVSTNAGFTALVFNGEVTGTTQDVTSLTVGQQLWYKVRAFNGSWGAYSTARTVVVNNVP